MDRLFSENKAFADRVPVAVTVIFAVCFLLGCVAGTVASCGAEDAGSILPAIIFASDASDPGEVCFGAFAVNDALFYSAALLLGMTVFGAFVLPALCFARGFSFALTFSALLRLTGEAGKAWVIVLFAAEAIVLMPVFIITVDSAYRTSAKLISAARGKTGKRIFGRILFRDILLCAAAVLITAAVKKTVYPHIFDFISNL